MVTIDLLCSQNNFQQPFNRILLFGWNVKHHLQNQSLCSNAFKTTPPSPSVFMPSLVLFIHQLLIQSSRGPRAAIVLFMVSVSFGCLSALYFLSFSSSTPPAPLWHYSLLYYYNSIQYNKQMCQQFGNTLLHCHRQTQTNKLFSMATCPMSSVAC